MSQPQSQKVENLPPIGARDIYEREAKERQVRKSADSVPENLPEQKGDARDKAGERVGVSGRSIDKIGVVAEFAPDKLPR